MNKDYKDDINSEMVEKLVEMLYHIQTHTDLEFNTCLQVLDIDLEDKELIHDIKKVLWERHPVETWERHEPGISSYDGKHPEAEQARKNEESSTSQLTDDEEREYQEIIEFSEACEAKHPVKIEEVKKTERLDFNGNVIGENIKKNPGKKKPVKVIEKEVIPTRTARF